MDRLPAVVVVGCPNAGKSTLVNRLSGTRAAVVHETPGITRDRKVVEADWAGRSLQFIDTGGFDAADRTHLGAAVRAQIQAGLGEADIVLFVVDGKAGPLPGDHEIADLVRRSRLPCVLVANKVDDPAREDVSAAFFELGLGEALPLSALHGTGTGDLLDHLVALLPEEETASVAKAAEVPVAIVGRPNAGKSSLLNALIGEPRVIVSEVPGTTRDAIDTTLATLAGRFRFVDTAGMRKAAKVTGVEYYSYVRSLESLSRAHVALVVVDATVGIGELDLSIASEAAKRGCATLLLANKWDLAQPDLEDLRGLARRKLRQQPEVLPVSARTGNGLEGLLELVTGLERRYTAHIPTPELNRALQSITQERTLPGKGGRRLKAYFIAQYRTAPPRFAVDVNDRRLVTRDFGFFVENRLRARFSLQGVPLIIDFKHR